MIEIPQYIKDKIGRGTSLTKTAQYLHIEQRDTPITIVETGTSRGALGGGPIGDGWASILWSWYAEEFNSTFYTVDIDKACIEEARRLIGTPVGTNFIISDSISFLESFKEEIHLLYLDSADDPNLMYKEFCIAEPKLKRGALVLLDDVGPDFIRGKGTILGPYLMQNIGYDLIYHDTAPTVNQALFRKVL